LNHEIKKYFSFFLHFLTFSYSLNIMTQLLKKILFGML
jgi:hypothetical protein